MKKIALLVLLSLGVGEAQGQTREIVYSISNDTTANYYVAYRPTGPVTGLLILLTSFGETPQVAANETNIHKIAATKGLLTVYASLQDGTATFYVDSLSQVSLDKLIIELLRKYDIGQKPFYLGGFSLGGAGVVKYAERAYSSTIIPKPKAIFAIDPPLDFERMFMSLEQIGRQSTVAVAKSEAEYFLKRIQYEFQGTPQDGRKLFHAISPYSYSDTLQTNSKSLMQCPIRLVVEPDIIWQMTERNRNIYDLNALDCSAMINSLKLLGNKRASLIVTTGKGYRKLTGRRNPHSWSIANSEETVNWLVRQ